MNLSYDTPSGKTCKLLGSDTISLDSSRPPSKAHERGTRHETKPVKEHALKRHAFHLHDWIEAPLPSQQPSWKFTAWPLEQRMTSSLGCKEIVHFGATGRVGVG